MADCGDAVISATICHGHDGTWTMTKEIIDNDYESVFSWHIMEQTGEKQNLMMNFLDTIREKCDFVIVEENVFNVNRFCYQLIIVYELYILGRLEKALKEIEIVVKSIDSCKFDETSNHYLAAYKHIACSTFAYISLSMNCYSEKIIENVKPINNMNQTEKSAIYAVKACVFMEYPPNGNAIALKLANEARNFYSKEPQWIVIWLKAKGRIRRFNNKKMPDKDEIEAADILSLQINPKPQFLINACKIYHDVAVFNRITNKEKSQTYFKLGFDLLINASKLINYDVKDLYSCLFAFLFAPKKFQSREAIYQIVEKLKTINNNCAVYDALGEYYFKYEKDYEKAKIYFSRGMFSGHFRCSMQLLKIECLLNPDDSFSYIQTLKMIYEVFASPKRRLIILKQMLLYYYDTKNPKELMYSLKLFLDQDIGDELKMQQLIDSQSFYNLHEDIKHKPFVNTLHDYVNDIRKNYKWNAEEKMVIDNTCTLFNKISKINRTYDNQFNKNNKNNFHQQCYEWKLGKKYDYNSNSQYDETKNHETNWRKKQENYEVAVCNPFTRNGNKTYGKHKSQKKEITKYQKEKSNDNVNKSLVKEFNKHLTIFNSPATEEGELNKLKNQHGHNKNSHVPNSNNDPLLYETIENNKLNLKNKYQDRHWMTQHNNKSNIQEQDNNNSLPNNSSVIHNSPPHIKERNKNKNWSNYQDLGFKDKHKFMTSKLDCQFQPARNLYDQTKQH